MLKTNATVAAKFKNLEETIKALVGAGAVKKGIAAKREIRKIRTGQLFQLNEKFVLYFPMNGDTPQYLSREFLRDGRTQVMDYVYAVNEAGDDKEMSLNALTSMFVPFRDGEQHPDEADRWDGSFIDMWKSFPTTEMALKAVKEKQDAGYYIFVDDVRPIHTAFIQRTGELRGIPQERDQFCYTLKWKHDDEAQFTELPADAPAQTDANAQAAGGNADANDAEGAAEV